MKQWRGNWIKDLCKINLGDVEEKTDLLSLESLHKTEAGVQSLEKEIFTKIIKTEQNTSKSWSNWIYKHTRKNN